MSKRAKRLEKMRNNPKDLRPDDLEALLILLGYVMRTGKGDHRVYTKPGEAPVVLDFGRSPVLEVYARNILELLKDK